MKFGKSLRRLRYGAWSAWYCDYKMLKKLIKQCSICCQENMDHHDAVKLTGVNRMRFFLSIRQEANKVSSLYSSTLDEWEKDFKQLVLQLDVHQRTRQNHQVPLDLVSKFTSLCNILDRLRGFVLLNHLAFMKILKKYDKKAALGGYAPVRESCMETLQLSPFYASSRLANHLAEAECLAASLTNLTSPDARPQKDSFKCGICLGVLRAPVVLVCAHRFCWTCLASAHKSQTHPACPICRKEQSLDPNNYSVHGVLEAFVQLHFSVDDNSEDDVSVTPSNLSEAVVLTPQKLLDISRAQDGLQKQLQTVTNMQQEAQELDTDDDDDNDTNTEADDMVIESETCAPVYGAQDQSPMVAKSLEAGINAPDVEVDNAQDVEEEEDEQDKEEATGDRSASVSIPPTVRAQNRIVRLPRFAHLLTHASVPGTFVALDIDETIHTCPHRPCQMMTERGLKAYQLILTSSPLYKDMPFAAKNRCTRILQAALAAKALVEPGGAADSDGEPRLSTADVIRALQAAGVFVFGLTARYAAQSAISRRELLSVGVDLTLCTPFPQGCVLRDESTDALYEDGVIFTNACEKGPVLDRFLARLFSQSLSAKTSPSSSSCLPSSFGAPPRIVFVDDRLSNCVSVARGLSTAAQLNVPVTAYHYTYATTGDDISQTPSESDSSEDVFDPAIVQCQIHHFLHTQEILEDPKASDMIAKFRAQQSAKANAVAALNAEKEKQSQQEQLKQEQFEEEQKRKFKAEYMQQNALKNKDKATATPAKSSPSASSSSSGSSSSSSSSSSLKHSASTALLSRVRGSPLSSFVNQSLAVSASGDGSAQCNLA